MCRQCGKPRPAGFTVTCGASDCQQLETRDNALRAFPRRGLAWANRMAGLELLVQAAKRQSLR